MNSRPDAKARGTPLAPPNRFGVLQPELDLEHLEGDPEFLESLRNAPTEYLPDTAQSIVSENQSPDIPFRYSLNPYRGCSHGCSYCYARPTHEYLGYNAGLDFETKIFVKHDAAKLFRDFLCQPSWQPETIVMSGVTDPYQPAEREFKLTRACLEVAVEAQQAIGIITKNALIVRDLDLLHSLAERSLVHVSISVTSLDQELTRVLEPRTSAPHARLRAIQALSTAGIPVRAMIAPIIPGLNDTELPALLAAVSEAGATSARYTMLRLPLNVEPIFLDWLDRHQPTRKEKVTSLLRSVRDGKLSDSQFGQRMRGTGEFAEQIKQVFHVFQKKFGLDKELPPYDFTRFQTPRSSTGQLRLF